MDNSDFVRYKDIDLAINRGIKYLTTIIQPDGGMPNNINSDLSGAWTTNEILGVFLTPCLDNHLESFSPLLDYIATSQLSDGSWPFVNENIGGVQSTCDGIFTLLKLIKTKKAVVKPKHIINRVKLSIEWLIKSQYDDGGWGFRNYQPVQGSKLAPTCMALDALWTYYGFSNEDKILQYIENGIRFIRGLQNPDGGWGDEHGKDSIIHFSVKVLRLLSKMQLAQFDDLIGRGTVALLLMIEKEGCFSVAIESCESLLIHHNTPYNLFSFFLENHLGGKYVAAILDWYIDHQKENGSWQLDPTNKVKSNPNTWITAETILALTKFGNLKIAKR